MAEEGDVEAARRLVLSNLRLVVKIAMEYRRAWTNTLDLVQEGNVGLMEAVQRYDPYLGVKLSSYAVYWIRAYILKYLIDNIRMVRVGSSRATGWRSSHTTDPSSPRRSSRPCARASASRRSCPRSP